MGTRGCYGFYKNGEDKLTYNHFDSYPSDLGVNIVNFIKDTSIEEMNKIFDKIVMVYDKHTAPTEEQIDECIDYFNGDVGDMTTRDWYCLLRKTQGNLKVYKGDLKYMIINNKFMGDSLFCEWAYVINLDDNVLEVYRGFQKSPQKNRYKKYIPEKADDYYNVKLLKSYPLDNIPEDWADELEKMDEDEI